jgi:hypothetical protein
MTDKEKHARNVIKERFKSDKLPKPISINYVGKWAYGDAYAVTCGLFKLSKYCVYFSGDEITHIRKR